MRASLAAAGAIGLAFLALTTPAQATYDPLGSGTAKLTLDKRFASFLGKAGVSLTASQGAKRRGGAYVLPVLGGRIDPTIAKGEIETEGALAFASARKKVPLRKITVKTTSQPLVAKVGGSQLKVATSSKLSDKRSGFGTAFTAKALRLTAKAATRLNKKLRPEVPFQAGQLLGSLAADAQPALVAIEEKGTATIALEAAFLAKLDSRFVSLNPIAPAQRFGAQLSFPIAPAGQLAPDGSQGTLRTAGDLEFLQLGAGQVFWQELWLDLGAHSATAEVDVEPTPTFPGKIGRVGVLGLDTAATAISSDPKARTISVANAPLTLSPGAAESFNRAFAQNEAPAFAAGEAVGMLSFGAQGQ